jgi:hypothetical protein
MNNGSDYIEKELQNNKNTKEETFQKLTKQVIGITDEGKDTKIKNMIGEIIIDFFLAIMTLVIIGLSELFSPNWEWAVYASATFWLSYGLTQSASWFARIWIYITRLKYHEKNDKEYHKLDGEIQNYVDKDFETPFIEEEANIDDYNRKKRAWLNRQKRKLIKIANKYRITNILPTVKTINEIDLGETPFVLETDFEILKRWWELKFAWKLRVKKFDRKKKRINSKVNKILNTITNQWVETNLETMKVKYNKVSRTILTNGYSASKGDDNTPNYKKNTSSIFLRYTMPSFMFMSIFMFIIVPLRGEYNNSASAWFQFLTKATLVFISGAFMWLSSQEMFNQTTKKATSERLSTINTYAKKRIKT